MNILYLLFSFTTGGTERLVTDICNEMVRREHRVHLYVVNDLYDQCMLDALDPKVSVQLQKRPAGGSDKLQTLFKIAAYIRKNQIQVVHCNSLDAPELLLLKPFLMPKIKVLYTVHGMQHLKNKSSWKIRYRNLLCHKIIGISDCVSQDILSAGIDPKKIVTIPNAINFSKFPNRTEKVFDPSRPVIGHVARIQPQVKGQDILIRAIDLLKKDHPQIQCIFAGAPAQNCPQDLESLKNLVSDLGLEENITFVGGITDVPGFLSCIDIFALPSRSEGFGISLVEAMAMGIPCIASNLDGPAEVLEHGKLGLLFPTEDAQALADKITEMIAHYPSYHSQATQQAAHVRQQYNITVMCDSLEALCG